MSDYSLEFTVEAVDPEVLTLFFGGPIPSPPTYSLLFDSVEWVSGEPMRPKPRKGWRRHLDRMTGRHRHALRLHAIRRAAWIEAGCPKVPMTTRTYIPRATLTPEPPATQGA